MHQLLLADILKFTISVLEKNFQKFFVSVFIQDFNHKFYKNFWKEQSHQLCLLLVLSQSMIHNICILADIDCTVSIRTIYMSSFRTITSILQNYCEICKKKVVLVSFQLTLSRLYTLLMFLLLILSITCWVHILKSLMFECSH